MKTKINVEELPYHERPKHHFDVKDFRGPRIAGTSKSIRVRVALAKREPFYMGRGELGRKKYCDHPHQCLISPDSGKRKWLKTEGFKSEGPDEKTNIDVAMKQAVYKKTRPEQPFAHLCW